MGTLDTESAVSGMGDGVRLRAGAAPQLVTALECDRPAVASTRHARAIELGHSVLLYRDTIRAHQNLANVPPAELARRVAGSSDLYQDDGRKPAASVNFVVAHDGLTLDDLYSCNGPSNAQPWPYGPSDGGTPNNLSWDHGGDRSAQRQAARTGMALLMLSAGVPMMTGGDEMLRSLRCNNNAYNLDSVANWLDWGAAGANASFTRFVKKLLAFRRAHPAVRPAAYGYAIAWLRDDGGPADATYLDDSTRHFLAWRQDFAGDASIYVGYNGYWGSVTATLPPPPAGGQWVRVSDTAAWMEDRDNFVADADGDAMDGPTYGLSPRSLLILVSR